MIPVLQPTLEYMGCVVFCFFTRMNLLEKGSLSIEIVSVCSALRFFVVTQPLWIMKSSVPWRKKEVKNSGDVFTTDAVFSLPAVNGKRTDQGDTWLRRAAEVINTGSVVHQVAPDAYHGGRGLS